MSGIDLIISGHTHTTLAQPILAGDTYIVSAGPYCENLGSITIEWTEGGGKTLSDYHLMPIDQTLSSDQTVTAMVERWKGLVGGTYLAPYGLTYDEVLTVSGFDLLTPESGVQKGNPLGELVADAFLWAVNNLEADAPDVPTVAITADGVLRASLYPGEITTAMAFDVLSMGVGSDGTSGFPLVACYLTGAELKAAAEVDASVTPLMPAAQLYMAGMEYSFNTHRMFFNRVTDIRLVQENRRTEPAPILGDSSQHESSGYQYMVPQTDRTYSELEDGQLYRVVTGMYSAQMLGTVKSKSLGLLSLEPKLADGTPVTDFEACILRDENGSEIKEWYALAAYLKSFGEDGLPLRYTAPDGRKDVSRSWNPVELIKAPNWITIVTLIVLAAAAVLAYFLIRALRYAHRRRRYGKKKTL